MLQKLTLLIGEPRELRIDLMVHFWDCSNLPRGRDLGFNDKLATSQGRRIRQVNVQGSKYRWEPLAAVPMIFHMCSC